MTERTSPPDVAVIVEPGATAPIRQSGRPPWWLWAPAILVLVPVLVPLGFLGWRVLRASGSAWEVVFSSRTFELAVRSVLFTGAVTASAAIVGVAAAFVTVRTDLAARRVWTVLVALPLVIPSYVIALALISASGPRGLFADLTGLGLPAVSGFLGAWLALTISTYPYVFLVTAAALSRLDPALEESARGLGASPWRAFRTVALPQLRPAIAAGSLLVALYTLSDFGAVSLVRFDAFTRVIYAQYQGRIDRTPAAVLSVVLILIALAILWAEQRTRGRAVYFSRRARRTQRLVKLENGTKRVAVFFLSMVTLVGLVLPVGVLVTWLIRGLVEGDTISMRWGAVTGSVAGSAAAALLAILAAIPIVVLAIRHKSRASAWLERAVFMIFSIPHITIALGMVFFASRYLGGLYQSFVLLAFIYATIFLAQATGSGRASLLQVNPHLEEASRGLGKGQLRTLREITIPLMWRGLLAGGVLVFLTTMKELPATLLLRPTGFDTLAVRIWSAADELFYARAAAPALLLVALSAIPMYYLAVRQDQLA